MKTVLAVMTLCSLVVGQASYSGSGSYSGSAVYSLGSTITAASCSASDVQAGINSASSGDTVVIPSTSCTYTTTSANTPSVNINKAITVQGGTVCTGRASTLACTDNTIITDATNAGFGEDPFQISVSGARLTGITFRGGASGDAWEYVGVSPGVTGVRIDHSHCSFSATPITMRCIQWFGGSGLVDHILVATANGGVDTYGANSFDTIYPGDYNWSHALTPGSADCVYIEDSEFIYTSVLDGAWDSYNGAKICFRYNDVQGTNMGSHGLDSSAGRSAILQEVYNNTWTNSGSAIYSWAASRGGTGFVFNNTVSSSGGSYTVYADLREYREDNAFSWGSTCAGSGLIDQNTAGQSGYACRDQIGRGPETAPASDWPINTSTPTYSEALIPMYFWGNSFKGSTPTIGQVNINNSSNTCSGCPVQTAQILNNRDFYMEAAAFNGTAGTGTGLLSARPGTCTPQVGYWATDTNTLYQCSATNTWTVYYAPYTYPHPLTQGSGGGA